MVGGEMRAAQRDSVRFALTLVHCGSTGRTGPKISMQAARGSVIITTAMAAFGFRQGQMEVEVC